MNMRRWMFLSLAALILMLFSLALANEPKLELNDPTPFGTFAGTDYVMHQGMVTFEDGEPLSVEFVVPADLANSNGRLLLEPLHPNAGAGARNDFLGHDFLFGQGFSHAAIGSEASWQQVAAFGRMLKEGQAEQIVGNIDTLYGIGFSASTQPLALLLLEPEGQNLFDVSFILTTGWPMPTPIELTDWSFDQTPYLPPETAGMVMVILTEADVVLWGNALRDIGTNPHYRSYEIAGAEHIPPVYGGQAVAYTPVIRALFRAGDHWATDGTAPPASTFFTATAELDPVYESMTGIARDENLNALGGIRLPEVALGQKHYVAVNAGDFVLMGQATDLSCEPLADGSVRFADHDSYVREYTAVTEQLVEEGFLLPKDAERMIDAAAASDIGLPDVCY